MRIRSAAISAAAIIAAFGTGPDAKASNQCVACAPGTYTSGTQTALRDACDTCPPDHYCPGSSDKIPCTHPKSTYGGTGKTAASDCIIRCSGGQYYDGTTCHSCPAGTYQSASSHQITSCNACPEYTWSHNGSASCRTFQLSFMFGRWDWKKDGCPLEYGHPRVWLDAGNYKQHVRYNSLGLTDPNNRQDRMGPSSQCWHVWHEEYSDPYIDFSQCKTLPCKLIGNSGDSCTATDPNCTNKKRHAIFTWESGDVRLKP